MNDTNPQSPDQSDEQDGLRNHLMTLYFIILLVVCVVISVLPFFF